MDIKGLSNEQKAQLFERDRRLEALLNSMALALVDAGFTWPDQMRRNYDWAARTLDKDTKSLAA